MEIADNSSFSSIVLRVVLTIAYRDHREIKRAYAIKASDVHAILRWVGAALVMRVNPADGTEVMSRGFGVELIERELVFAPREMNIGKVC